MVAIPPGFGTLTAAQGALAELLQVPRELLVAASRHSEPSGPSPADDFAAWVELLPQARRSGYLVRLARNEPGLSRLLVRELRELALGGQEAPSPAGERITYGTLLVESTAIKAQLERERREQAQAARRRQLREIHDHQDTYWHQVEQEAARGSGAGYDEAVRLLVDLRAAAEQASDTQVFEARFRAWVQPHLRRPALVKRLQKQHFALP